MPIYRKYEGPIDDDKKSELAARTALDGPRTTATALDDVRTATAVALDNMRTALDDDHGSTSWLQFYVPSTGRDDVIIPQVEFTRRTEQIARLFCRLFRGCTIYPTLGYWLDREGNMINERINVVKTATATALLLGHVRQVYDVATASGRLWHQRAVMLLVNGSKIMIDI